nr:hypothetical protein [Tanacetum cinerariifolium]
FIMPKEVFVLNKIKETMLELKVVSSNYWNDNCILVTLGGFLEQLSHSTLIGHRNYGREMFFKIRAFNPLLELSLLVRSIHKSDLVEIMDMSMRVLFIMPKEVFVLNKIKETMLELKVVSSNYWNDNCILVTLGGFLEQLSHSTLIGHHHHVQNNESLKNFSEETIVSKTNQEPPQDSDIHQLIEECSIKVPEQPGRTSI